MKRIFVGIFAGALLLLGCGDRSPAPTEVVTGSLPTLPPSAATGDAATITTAARALPTTTATSQEIAPGPTTSAAPVRTTTTGRLAAGWTVCTNAQHGFSVGHPAGWHTAYGCRYLDPAPLNITPDSDGFFSAVNIVGGDTSFDEARERSSDRFAVIVLQEETTIGGHRAVRYETEATGAGMFPKGSRLYSVVIDHEGQAFEVVTAWFPGTSTSEYQLRKKLVDEVAKTARFM